MGNPAIRLRVRQRVLGAGVAYVVMAADVDDVVFEVRSVPTNVGHTFEMLDPDGTIVASIHQHLLPVEPNYVIRREGIDVGEVHRDLAAVTFPRFVLGGIRDGLVLTADQSDTKFNVLHSGSIVARVERVLSFVGSAYSVDFLRDVDVPTILCLLIAADDAMNLDAK